VTPQLVAPERDISLQGHYAGAVTRLLAYLVDVVASSASFWLLSGLVALAVRTVTGGEFDPTDHRALTTVAFGMWELVYFAYPLAVSGRTLGAAVVGLEVVQADGSPIRPRQALVRVVAFPLSLLLFGLGFVGILVQREHRALHDLIAGTAVVYGWDARAARLRFLAQRPR
jgi:uncharacterized RDD family membrane protein YckC